ncbi:hypothetical protein PUMCH_004042 [Australozyma saopauloensis]|uniref:Uncharacterized protein n=1 Tax=Australozyma saopauloensis TaxID=291208 RepID=A0AAX4HFL4_9ASCO|nr:hypothetical protein PUMCH_004042 [[Candida] saopauloensis]
MVTIVIFLATLFFVCCVIWYVTPLVIRNLDERFMFVSREPRKFECDRKLDGARYFVMNGHSKFGRSFLLDLADRGAYLHLVHTPREEKIYKQLAVELKKKAKKCNVILEKCDLLLYDAIEDFSWEHVSKFGSNFSGCLYFKRDCSSLSLDSRALRLTLYLIKALLSSDPDRPKARFVFVSEFGGSPFHRDERYDRILTILEKWQDYRSHFNCPRPAPEVAFANTGCIWNGSEFSFAYVLHWLGHKVNANMPCHQGQNSVLHALLSKEESRGDGVYFVNDSEWHIAPHFERVDSEGKKIVHYKLKNTPEHEALRGKSYEEVSEYYRKKAYVKESALKKIPKPKLRYDIMSFEPAMILPAYASELSGNGGGFIQEGDTLGEEETSDNEPSELLEILQQLAAISSSISRIERRLVAVESFAVEEKNSEGHVQNVAPPQEFADHSDKPEDVSTQEIDQQLSLEPTPTLTSSETRMLLSPLPQFMPRLTAV